jgi:hypothetical protein
MPELADIFRRYGPEYIARFGKNMLPSHHRALQDIIDCRTEVLGGHVVKCDHCLALDYAYHSCKNRGCPKCHANDTQRWLDKRRTELLETVYFHVVFTLPAQLREIVRSHQKTLYSILMQAAAYALLKLAADPKYVGAKIGMLAVLHTWTNGLAFHPHGHFLVPGGGISPDGRYWFSSRRDFLVPVKALSPIFRAKFMEMAQDALPCVKLPVEVWENDWVVYAKPAVQGSDKVLQYLARYVHRVAITNNRILAIENDQVTFRYKETGKQKKKWQNRWKTMTLPVLKFMARFLQHMPPQGFHKVRYYGLWCPANRSLLNQVQLRLAGRIKADDTPLAGTESDGLTPRQAGQCRFCKLGFMRVIEIIPRGWQKALAARSPP